MAVNRSAVGGHGPAQPLGHLLLPTVREELADERERHDSIISRAMTLAAGGGAAAALVVGLSRSYDGRWPLKFFVAVGVAGLLYLVTVGLAWWAVRFKENEQLDLTYLRK